MLRVQQLADPLEYAPIDRVHRFGQNGGKSFIIMRKREYLCVHCNNVSEFAILWDEKKLHRHRPELKLAAFQYIARISRFPTGVVCTLAIRSILPRPVLADSLQMLMREVAGFRGKAPRLSIWWKHTHPRQTK